MTQHIIFIFIFSFILSGCLDTASPPMDDTCSNFDREAQTEFLQQNAEREEVTVTESGLQYRVVEPGDGENPGQTSRVSIEYTGRLIDGTVFDSTENVGPVQFNVNQVIQGFSEALQLMNEGSTYEVVLPPDLAYGNNPPQNSGICPGAVLIFEIQLIEIVSTS